MTKPTPRFSDEDLHNICNIANTVSCECPAYLVGLLRQVRKFRYYTAQCPQNEPEEREIHQWLEGEILQIEQLMSEIVYEFMQREDLLDETGQLVYSRLADRTYQAIVKRLPLVEDRSAS